MAWRPQYRVVQGIAIGLKNYNWYVQRSTFGIFWQTEIEPGYYSQKWAFRTEADAKAQVKKMLAPFEKKPD